MLPLLADGDWVRVRGDRPLRWGDVALVDADAGLVIHRVIALGRDGPVLRGDHCPAPDHGPRRSEPSVLGRVVQLEGLRGRPLDRGLTRWIGLAAATVGWMQLAASGYARGPRPARVVAAGACLERLFGSRMGREAAVTLALARLGLGDHTRSASSGMASLAARHGELPRPLRAASCWRAASTWGSDREVSRCLAQTGDLRWSGVIELARVGEIAPLVWSGTHLLAPGHAVPPGAARSLRRAYAGSLARSWESARLLAQCAARLARSGIPVLVHKGAALGFNVYRDRALRLAGDLDLSVRDADLPRARDSLADIRRSLLESNPTLRSPRGFHIELDGTAHHDMEPSLFGAGRWSTGRLDWDGVWARAEPHQLHGATVLIPSPTDLLLLLVANTIRRGFRPVRQIVDLAAVLHRHGPDLDWDRFRTEMRRTGLDKRAWVPLGLARDWLGAGVPAPLLEPPPGLRMAAYERAILDWKRRHPFGRMPTRVLWSGGYADALSAARATAHRL